MGFISTIDRRLRRQLGTRVFAWTAICFFLFFALPTLRTRWNARQSLLAAPLAFGEKERLLLPQCSLVPPTELHRLQTKVDMSVHSYRGGVLLRTDEPVTVPASLCVLVAVPQTKPESGIYKDIPVPGEGPDLMHLYFNTSDVRVSIPPLKPFPAQAGVELQQTTGAIVYYTELKLPDAGTYDISAEREFKNWRWAKQWYHNGSTNAVHFLTGHIEPLKNTTDDVEKIMEVNRVIHDGKVFDPEPIISENIFPQQIVARSATSDKPAKTRCNALSGFDAQKGRWYRQADYPHLAEGMADEWGFVYDLDECSLEYFTDVDVTDCLAGKTIHVFGDSNSRRLSRAIMSAGRWCRDVTMRCQTEDWGDAVHKVVWNASTSTLDEEMETPEHNGQFELNDRKPFFWGKNTTLYFNFMQAIVMAPKDWLSNFYDPGQFTVGEEGVLIPFTPDQIVPGAHARRPTDMPKPDLVVVGIGAWDEAFDWTYDDFARTVPHFRDALLQAYPDSLETKLALRLSQGHCCRRNWTEDLRRFSGGRIAKFGEIIRESWQIENGHGMGGRVAVVDASGMSGRPEVVNDFGAVGSNHQRAAHTRLEAQILLNQVCARDGNGKAVWKEEGNGRGALMSPV